MTVTGSSNVPAGGNVPGGPVGGGSGSSVPGGGTSGTGSVPGGPTTDPATGSGSVPGSGPTGGSGGIVPPDGTAQRVGPTPGELAVLRLIATDPDFRVAFGQDPVAAITNAGVKLTTADLTRLEKLTPDQLETVATGIEALSAAATSAASSGLRSEGSNTLVYAIIAAVLIG